MQRSKPQDQTPPCLTVRYNHRDLTLDEKQAAKYAQIGLKYESAAKTLGLLAALDDVSVSEYIKTLTENARKKVSERYGGLNDTQTDKMIALLKGDESEPDEEKEFSEFFPETKLSDIEKRVSDLALERGISITDAYLRLLYKENRLCDEYKTAKAKQAEKTLGSMRSAQDSGVSGAVNAMLSGLKK